MANMLQLALRAVQFVFTLIIMAITGNIIDTAFGGNPSVINYTMFVAVFSMLTLFYAIAICFKEEMTFHKLVPSILDLLNVFFFFCAGVALAAELGVHSCSNAGYTRSNHITNGAGNTKARCQMSQTITAFSWFNFALYVVTALFSFMGGNVNMRAGGSRPAMSKV